MRESDRLFFAVPIEERSRDEIRQAAESPLREVPGLRLIPSENWHLTLRFLGDTTPEARDEALEALGSQPLPARFDIRLSGWGAFPRPASARVLWIGVDDPLGRLAVLNGSTEAAAHTAGFEPESRPYSPHLTIGRFRAPANLNAVLPGLPAIETRSTVDRIVLFRSHLGAGGARYEVVRTLALGG